MYRLDNVMPNVNPINFWFWSKSQSKTFDKEWVGEVVLKMIESYLKFFTLILKRCKNFGRYLNKKFFN